MSLRILWFNRAIEAAKATKQENGVIASLIYARALPKLALDKFTDGWNDYEHRWQAADYAVPRYSFSVPVWQGQTPDQLGGSLLITSEPGLGETLQFCRYILLLADQGHDIIWEVPAELYSLLKESFDQPKIKIFPYSADFYPENKYAFAAYCGIMSLPQKLKITPEDTLTDKIPYFRSSSDKIASWRDRLSPSRLKVGLVWAGNPKHPFDIERSLPIESLKDLLKLEGIAFYSLQKGKADLERLLPFGLTELCDGLGDFSDTAAAIRNLDLVITVDTAVAHLAGGLNCPAWLMVSHIPDWRWRDSGAHSRWYPSFRVFRQSEAGNWSSVITDIAQALQELKANV